MTANINRLIRAARGITSRFALYLRRGGLHIPEKDDLDQQAALEALNMHRSGNLKDFAKNIRDRIRSYIEGSSRVYENIDDYDISDGVATDGAASLPALVDVEIALHQLPPVRRDAILAMMHGRTQESLGRYLGISQPTVCYHLHNGLRELRRILKGDD